MAQCAGELCRAERNDFGIPGRASGQNAEAMRERVERLAVADLRLADDLLQREIFLEHFRIDQFERRVLRGRALGVRRSSRRLR